MEDILVFTYPSQITCSLVLASNCLFSKVWFYIKSELMSKMLSYTIPGVV